VSRSAFISATISSFSTFLSASTFA
jgi:hypothetical protein